MSPTTNPFGSLGLDRGTRHVISKCLDGYGVNELPEASGHEDIKELCMLLTTHEPGVVLRNRFTGRSPAQWRGTGGAFPFSSVFIHLERPAGTLEISALTDWN